FGAKSEKKDPGDVADYPLQWHPQLQAELDERGLSGRVFYARSLTRMEQHLLAKFSPLSPEEREELWNSIDIDDLHRRLTEGIYSTPLDPRSAALPLATTAAWVIASVYGSEDFELSEAAHRPGGAWTGRATCEIDATIEVTKTSGDVVEVRKPLIVSARIDVTDNNEISSLSIESIDAEATDPQHRAWKRADAAQWSGIADSITAANAAHLRGLIEPITAANTAQWSGIADSITAANAAHLRGLIEPATAASAAHLRGLIEPATAASAAHLRGLIEPATAASAAHLRGLIEPTSAAQWSGIADSITAANAAQWSGIAGPNSADKGNERSDRPRNSNSGTTDDAATKVDPELDADQDPSDG
ncbi:hypothetical protein M3B38_15955, partial [Dietzia cinnamea]|uniref:hypothetical protein n=1 Tax=Dietzia cinnamea TaxID=321318 RepID=UPI0021A808C1